MDEFCNLLTIQAVSATFIEDNPGIFDMVREVVSKKLALHGEAGVSGDGEDGSRATRAEIRRPLLMTNGTRDHDDPTGTSRRRASRPGRSPRRCRSGRYCTIPEIGHADLLECPEEAVSVVSAFFETRWRKRAEASHSSGARRSQLPPDGKRGPRYVLVRSEEDRG